MQNCHPLAIADEKNIIYENSIKRPKIKDYGLFWYKDSKTERKWTLLRGI